MGAHQAVFSRISKVRASHAHKRGSFRTEGIIGAWRCICWEAMRWKRTSKHLPKVAPPPRRTHPPLPPLPLLPPREAQGLLHLLPLPALNRTPLRRPHRSYPSDPRHRLPSRKDRTMRQPPSKNCAPRGTNSNLKRCPP